MSYNIISASPRLAQKKFFSLPSRRLPRYPLPTAESETAAVVYPHVNQLRMATNAGSEEFPLPCVVFDGWGDVRASIGTNLDIDAVAIRDHLFRNFAPCARGFIEALSELRRSGLRLRPIFLVSTNDTLGYGWEDMAALAGLLREGRFVYCWIGDDDSPGTLDLFRNTYYSDFSDMFRQDPKLATKRYLDAVFDAANLVVSRVRARGR